MVTCASMFAGGGGWEVGADFVGVEPLWSLELDPEIARVNHDNVGRLGKRHATITGSVLDIDPRGLPGVDILFASPPCQPFSKLRMRNRRAVHCDEGVGVAVADYVEALRPRVVLMENVPTYLSSAAYGEIVRRVRAAGYHHDEHRVNAYDYNVPSSRRRAIIRFSLDPLPRFPAKQHPRRSWLRVLGDLIPTFPVSKLAAWQQERVTRMFERGRGPAFPFLVSSNNGNGPIFKRGGVVNVAVGPDAPGFVVLSTYRSMSSTRVVTEDGVVRTVSVRGLARLASFPDDYRLPEDPELAVKVVGNAVPPSLAARMVAPFLPAA